MKYLPKVGPGRDCGTCTNVSSHGFPVHAYFTQFRETGSYSHALVQGGGQGKGACLAPWPDTRERLWVADFGHDFWLVY